MTKIENVELLFRRGVGYDSAKLVASTRGVGRDEVGPQSVTNGQPPAWRMWCPSGDSCHRLSAV